MTVVGAALRVPSFSDSLFGDELGAYFVVTGRGFGGIVDTVQTDQEITPPLYFLFAGLTQGIGSATDSLRWVPTFAGVASIPLTYLLGLRTVGARAGMVGAAIMALSPFAIFYSTEARPYALLMLLCLGSTLALLRALERGGLGWWVLYAALSCAAMYTHYTGVFVLAGGLIGALQPFGHDAVKTDLRHWAVSHPLTAFSVREMPGAWRSPRSGLVLRSRMPAGRTTSCAAARASGFPGEGWRSCSPSRCRPRCWRGSTAP